MQVADSIGGCRLCWNKGHPRYDSCDNPYIATDSLCLKAVAQYDRPATASSAHWTPNDSRSHVHCVWLVSQPVGRASRQLYIEWHVSALFATQTILSVTQLTIVHYPGRAYSVWHLNPCLLIQTWQQQLCSFWVQSDPFHISNFLPPACFSHDRYKYAHACVTWILLLWCSIWLSLSYFQGGPTSSGGPYDHSIQRVFLGSSKHLYCKLGSLYWPLSKPISTKRPCLSSNVPDLFCLKCIMGCFQLVLSQL